MTDSGQAATAASNKGSATENGAEGWALPAYQTRSRDQRDRLLRAAERVFAAKGFWQAHVTEISQAAGCSVGSFYRRFKDKETLFFALQDFMHERAHENIRVFFDDPARESESLSHIFDLLIGNTIRSVKGISGYYRALFEMSLRDQIVWPKMRELEEYQGQRIAELLMARGISGTRSDLALAAQFVTRMANGQIISVVTYGPGPYAVTDVRFRKELTQLVTRYLAIEAD